MASEKPPLVTTTRSLENVHSSVPIPKSPWRRMLAFAGPAFLVSVGYMDPGNWGTDLEGGSHFGYRLLWVLLLSNVMAVLLQGLSTRLGIVAGRDLAQACREEYPRPAVWILWVLSELAIAATDLAEVIGFVIALKLLFRLDYLWGLLICAGDTFLLLALQRRGVRILELLTLGLIGIIAGTFVVEIILARPDWLEVASGLLPSLAPGQTRASLYVAIAMLGATVMPHNLYLHSALVQTRAIHQSNEGKRQACKYNLIDSIVALNGAFFVNASILILAGASFYPGTHVRSLQEAHGLLANVWNTTLASILFAVALLASGQSSTLTGTLAGQVVMEGFVHLRLRPWIRRLLTRSVAIIPALGVIALAGQESSGLTESQATAAVDERLLDLLVLSQAILSFQLPFAIVPLLQFTRDRKRMGEFASRGWLKVLSGFCALVVIGLNGYLIAATMNEWGKQLAQSGTSPWWVYGTIGPVAGILALFLVWLTVWPLWKRRPVISAPPPAPVLQAIHYQRIGVAVEFAGTDDNVLQQATALAQTHQAELVIIHVVEGAGASLLGSEADDQESRHDRVRMANLVEFLRKSDLTTEGVLGFGVPAEELTRIAEQKKLDLLVLGTHGHRFLADMALGSTVDPVLHRLTIPVLVVPSRRARN